MTDLFALPEGVIQNRNDGIKSIDRINHELSELDNNIVFYQAFSNVIVSHTSSKRRGGRTVRPKTARGNFAHAACDSEAQL
ncbi:MAG: hypothetical protein WD002_00545 [Pseudomonadales bacterium]